MVEHITGRAVFHGTSGIHHQHLIADTGDHTQVMGDHNNRRVELILQLIEQRHDLRLHRHIQRRGRFIRNQQLRLAQQRHRNHNALAHPAGELMRIHIHPFAGFRHFHRVQHPDRFLKSIVRTQTFMQHQHFRQLFADFHVRIERGHRILEDHGNLFRPHFVQRFFFQIENFTPVEHRRAADHTIAGQQSHQRKRRL